MRVFGMYITLSVPIQTVNSIIWRKISVEFLFVCLFLLFFSLQYIKVFLDIILLNNFCHTAVEVKEFRDLKQLKELVRFSENWPKN